MNYACPLRIRYGITGQQGEALPCVRRYGTGGGQGAPLSAGTVPVVISGAGVIFLCFYPLDCSLKSRAHENPAELEIRRGFGFYRLFTAD